MNDQFASIRGQKVYFASDFHLGSPNKKDSLDRERKIVRWLTSIEGTAAGIILVGDMFDFWFEYKHVVPKGYIRFLGKLAYLREKGIPIIFFAGNHDLWMFDYFEKELDIPVFRQPTSFDIAGYKVLIAHGDGLGPGDGAFKFFKKVFTNGLAQRMFKWLHPDAGITLARLWSHHSKKKHALHGQDEGEDTWLQSYAEQVEAREHHDLYVFGHLHQVKDLQIGERARYYNLGEWIKQGTYLEIGHDQVALHTFND